MKTLKEVQKATGLRMYSEEIDGVEVHSAGKVVFHAKNKPQAEAFLRGALWQLERSGVPSVPPEPGD